MPPMVDSVDSEAGFNTFLGEIGIATCMFGIAMRQQYDALGVRLWHPALQEQL